MEQGCSGGDGSVPGCVVQVSFPSIRTAVLDGLNRQREEGRLCDLSIQVQGQIFRAHRCVMAASSPYFHDQVLLKNVTTVSLPAVMDPTVFESVLSSAYTGQLSIVRDDIVNYVTVASFLQMWHIVDKCTELLKRPRPAGDAPSRQQSPSSTDCLYAERERQRDREQATPEKRVQEQGCLPPLATWRKPQQGSRWNRPRTGPQGPPLPLSSHLDPNPTGDSDYFSCEDIWQTSGSSGSYRTGVFPGDTGRVRARPRPKGAPEDGQKPAGRARDRGPEGSSTDGEKQAKKCGEQGTEADEGMGEDVEEEGARREAAAGDFPTSVYMGEEREQVDDRNKQKVERDLEKDGGAGVESAGVAAGRLPWQVSSWPAQEEEEEDEEDEEEVDFSRFAEDGAAAFGGSGTYDEIEDGTGQVSQRPLVPASPSDDSEYRVGPPELNWTPVGGGGAQVAQPTTQFTPSSSPPIPSSSSSLTPASTPYSGKVHFCHCGKAYTLKSMRDRHVKMQHLNLRPFSCPVCSKSFKMKHHLTKHLKTHGGLRPYECGICGKKVVWRDSFLRHQARCQRVATAGMTTSYEGTGADTEETYPYGFEEAEGLFTEGGQVKVEESDFQGETESGIGGLMNVNGCTRTLMGMQQLKEEGESYS